ncbi:MAG: glycosyltransferase [Acidimicrobiales bacterium]
MTAAPATPPQAPSRTGRAAGAAPPRPAPPEPLEAGAFRNARVAEIDLGEGLRSLAAEVDRDDGRAILTLVRLHGRPLGMVLLSSGAQRRAMRAWPEEVRHGVGEALVEHLAADGRTSLDPPSTGELWRGLAAEEPPCLAERRRALADAPAISVIVATRNRPALLRRCLDSLLLLEYPSYEVLVVDNDPPTGETEEVVRSTYEPTGKVRYLSEGRRGLGAAHNRGLAEATGALVAFTDDDVVVDRHWLGAIAESFASRPGVACVTGLIVPAELETLAQALLESHGAFAKGFRTKVVDTGANRPPDPLFPFAVGQLGSGANMAFETAVLRGLGGFDAALGTGTLAKGGDDLAAFLAVLGTGRALAYEPSAIVWHRHRRDLPSLRGQVYGYGVGLGAYLASALAHEPRLALDALRHAPAGLAHVLRPDSARNRTRPAGWPPRLVRLELAGMAYGPVAYALSRARGRSGRTPCPGRPRSA